MNPRLILVAALGLGLGGCAAPIPTLSHFDHFERQYDETVVRKTAELEKQLASGEITQTYFDSEIEQMEANRTDEGNLLVLQNHDLRESYYGSQGIPTAKNGIVNADMGSGAEGGSFSEASRSGTGFGAAPDISSFR